MYLKEIKITNFRNYKNTIVKLYNKINIIYGNNAVGKTNLLESIYVLGTIKSHRSFIDNNLIKKGCEFFVLKGRLMKNNFEYNLELNYKSIKKLKIDNKEIKKVSDYISKMNVIIFYPDDLEIIKGSPSIRRNFMNIELIQLHNNYINILSEYNQILKMRNELLKSNLTKNNQYLQILTEYLIKRSIIIYKMRDNLIFKINELIPKIYKNITGDNGFYIKYKPNIIYNDNSDKTINDMIIKYKENYDKELRLGKTLFGPHLDNIEFFLNDINLKYCGSQGQQRIAIIVIKLSLIEIYKCNNKETPILLLDDVFSELDIKKKNNLLKYIDNNMQTIITTTDLDNFDEKILSNANIVMIENGKIIEK